MIKSEKTSFLRTLEAVIGIFLIVSVFVFIGVGVSVQYQDLRETYSMAERATSFIEGECQKFDNYTKGLSARSMQDLLDTANGLKKYMSSEKREDSEFLSDFIHTEHLGGVLILDEDLSLIAQANMDHLDSYSLWRKTISGDNIKDILKHPLKTYVDNITLDEISYDVAVTATDDGKELILCYSSCEKPSTDPYELSIKNVLINNTFDKNPTLIITDGTQVLSTNSSVVDEMEISKYQELTSGIEWKNNEFTKFKYGNNTYYGLRRVYNEYFIYAVYASDEVFSHRTNYIIFGLMIYLGIGIVILAVQRHFDKVSIEKLEKQLRIINAISTAYDSTFLLHIDEMTLEPIKPSERLKAIFEKHSNPYDFLFAVCKTEIETNDHAAVMHFLDLDTVAERLKGKPFLGCEVKDCHGTWYSVVLIPQKYDENGNIQALLAMTRNITSVKQTEELTFKDKLTGLYNRNYMESRSKKGIRAGDFPVSLIMADCNYLKRTNDTLGHEYGDLLLQRVANIITETIPENCVAMRVGGDEFLILCMQCSNEMASQLIAAMRKKLAERSDEKLTLSVSFGVSTTEEGEFIFEKAYEEADQKMYIDKKASRIERVEK